MKVVNDSIRATIARALFLFSSLSLVNELTEWDDRLNLAFKNYYHV